MSDSPNNDYSDIRAKALLEIAEENHKPEFVAKLKDIATQTPLQTLAFMHKLHNSFESAPTSQPYLPKLRIV